MRQSDFVAVLLLGSAWSDKSDVVYTVDQRTADEALLSRTLAACRDNSGGLRGAANCQNAESAGSKLRFQVMRKALGG